MARSTLKYDRLGCFLEGDSRGYGKSPMKIIYREPHPAGKGGGGGHIKLEVWKEDSSHACICMPDVTPINSLIAGHKVTSTHHRMIYIYINSFIITENYD